MKILEVTTKGNREFEMPKTFGEWFWTYFTLARAHKLSTSVYEFYQSLPPKLKSKIKTKKIGKLSNGAYYKTVAIDELVSVK